MKNSVQCIMGYRPRLQCRELMILGRERELPYYKIKIVIIEIKAVKSCRNRILKIPLFEELASYMSEVFDHRLQLESICFQLK